MSASNLAIRPVRFAAISNLMFESALTSSEVAALNLEQVKPNGPKELLEATRGELVNVPTQTGAAGVLTLSEDVCKLIGMYLEYERAYDTDGISNALFLSTSAERRRSGLVRVTPDEVDLIIGGESNLRSIRTAPGSSISGGDLESIRAFALDWLAQKGGSVPQSVEVVATSANAAVSALTSGDSGTKPDRAIYLVVLRSNFTLEDRGSRELPRLEPEGWVVLFLDQTFPLGGGKAVFRRTDPGIRRLGLGKTYLLWL